MTLEERYEKLLEAMETPPSEPTYNVGMPKTLTQLKVKYPQLDEFNIKAALADFGMDLVYQYINELEEDGEIDINYADYLKGCCN